MTTQRPVRAVAAEGSLAWRITAVSLTWILLNVYAMRPVLSAASHVGFVPEAWFLTAIVAMLPLAAFFAGRSERAPFRETIQRLGYIALGVSSLLIAFVFAADVVRLTFLGAAAGLRFVAGAHGPGALDLLDRVHYGALVSATNAVTLFGAGLLSLVGAGQACSPRVKRVSVPVNGLHPDLDGLRIVQISDVHIGAGIQERFVDRLVARINELDADVIAITGDLADGLLNEYRSVLDPLSTLRSKHGTFYVTGNHEYYWGVNAWVEAIRATGVRPLMNEHVVIRHGSAELVVGGVTDLGGHHFSAAHRTDPRRAFEGAPQNAFRLMLAHQPQSAKGALEENVDLQLSGHTHGGQYFPFNLLIRFFQPIVSGLHRIGDMWLYVSPGTGYWGPPTRLGVPGEITVLELRKG